MWRKQSPSVLIVMHVDLPARHGGRCLLPCGSKLQLVQRSPVMMPSPVLGDELVIRLNLPPYCRPSPLPLPLIPFRERTEAWRIDINTCAATHTRARTHACREYSPLANAPCSLSSPRAWRGGGALVWRGTVTTWTLINIWGSLGYRGIVNRLVDTVDTMLRLETHRPLCPMPCVIAHFEVKQEPRTQPEAADLCQPALTR